MIWYRWPLVFHHVIMIRPTHKSRADVEREWDALAPVRETQISHSKDISFTSVLLPAIQNLSQESDFTSVIDVGCGLGFVTDYISSRSDAVTAIDISSDSIRIAHQRLKHRKNVSFFHSSMEDFPETSPSHFSLAISSMTLMTVLDIRSFLSSLSRVLKPGSHFIFTITHPCFWPRYWGYESEDWFDYNKEIIIEAPFSISRDKTNLVTTHIHRPLDMYVECLHNNNFAIDTLIEPYPPAHADQEYLKNWSYPRFVGFRCVFR